MLFPVGSVPTGPPIETKKAILFLDFQNEFVDPRGNLPIKNVLPFVSKLPILAHEFRSKGEVIWIGTEYTAPRPTINPITGSYSVLLKQFIKGENANVEEEDDSLILADEYHGDKEGSHEDPLDSTHLLEQIPDPEAFLAPMLFPSRQRCCVPGLPGIEYPEVLDKAINRQKDLVLLKSQYSAFVDTPLLMHLRTRLITELYICGSLSNISVYATVLDAVCHGMSVTLVEDCLGYNDEDCHEEAMRQMADSMGAEGTDYQELLDELAGILGDVVREEDFGTTYQVSLPPAKRKTQAQSNKEHINAWISRLEPNEDPPEPQELEGSTQKSTETAAPRSRGSDHTGESTQKSKRDISIERTPPRKRSTSECNEIEEGRQAKLSHKPSTRRTSGGYSAEQLKPQMSSSPDSRRPSHGSSTRSFITARSQIISDLPSTTYSNQVPEQIEAADEEYVPDVNPYLVLKSKRVKKPEPSFIKPSESLGQGDSYLQTPLLSALEADVAFHTLRSEVKWAKMYHLSGEVPRLVAVQGDITDNGFTPIYRHPADETPELFPFDATVNLLRTAAENVVGHPLNHVLIQFYRNPEDNISEHSDKTLDIVRGSKIVNLSLGARRTMILRTKKSALPPDAQDDARPSQRIPLYHNSLFILGEETNRYWLHCIRADKRRPAEKDLEELAFNGERISLTFRHIGTFIDPAADMIWGQGATAKDWKNAKKILNGKEAEAEGEKMIRAFGQENHQSKDFNWHNIYGQGFDVVNFEMKKVG